MYILFFFWPMFYVPETAYSLLPSSVREFMAPTNEAVEVPRPLPAARRHEFTEDYFRDDMAVFEVEGVIFRLPKYLFEPGPGKFEPLLFGEKGDGEDSSEDAISLLDLTADEFRALIDFFLPYRCISRGGHLLQHWINLLSISTKYQLESIRPVAIKGIDAHRPKIDPAEKYALATKYMVKEWEEPSLEILYQRPDPLTLEEVEKLGLAVAIKVFKERERILTETGLLHPLIGMMIAPHPGESRCTGHNPLMNLPPPSRTVILARMEDNLEHFIEGRSGDICSDNARG